ncbi:hypothetical protein GJAV_G00119980 [Gymnothorax javanicus]|nr:hypothetical protein GJAV_G00119980 [Gymnothorax javanicus]
MMPSVFSDKHMPMENAEGVRIINLRKENCKAMILRSNMQSVSCLLGALCTVLCIAAADDPAATGGTGLTFSHVYSVDLSQSSDCKHAGHTLPQDQAGELQGTPTTVALDGDNDIVFKHNIRLQAPKCGCEDLEAFRSLLYRVNGLEEEVNYLKSQCSQGCCSRGGGVDTTCSGHGTYQHDTCGCVCNPGWEGPDCSTSTCPDECNDNGRCVDGRCVCYEGYGGEDCSVLLCPDDCNDKGHCVNGACVCFEGFSGDRCELRRCRNDCSGNGRCVDGNCVCDDGFFEEDCSKVLGPKNLQLVQALEDSLLVEWDLVRGVEYYVLSYHPKGNQRAVQTDITSEADRLVASTVVPSVDSIRVLGQTEDSILVDWQNPAVQLDHFRLTHSDPSGQEEREEVPMSQEARTKHTIVGLNPGTEYVITVQAIRGADEGKASSVMGITDLDAPTNLETREVTEDTITVGWDRTQADIDGYVIRYTSPDGSSQEIPVGRGITSYVLTGLRPGVAYTVYIWAVKGLRASRKTYTEAETDLDAPTNLVTREVTEDAISLTWDKALADIDGYVIRYTSPDGSSQDIPALAPAGKTYAEAETELDAPTNLVTSEVTEDTITLTWDKALADIDGYVIRYTSPDGSSQDIPVGPNSTSYRLTGLRPGVSYTIYIWAVKGSRTSRKDVRRRLRQARADVEGYLIRYTSPDGSSQDIPVSPDSASYRLTGLRPGVAYTVYIWAVKGSRYSRKIHTAAETDLDAPTNLVTREVTEDAATVIWDKPRADIDGYVIRYTSPNGTSQDIPVRADSASYRLTGLRPGVVYTIYIWAVKGSRTSRKTHTEAETEIDAPSNLKASGILKDAANLTWKAPLATIDGYILTYRPEDNSARAVEHKLRAGEKRFGLTGLEMGKKYIVTLQAYRGAKKSRLIQISFSTVGVAYPFPMDCTQVMKNGISESGVHTIYVNNDRSKPMQVFCDMTTDGGGWAVLQRRTNGKLDFMKRWRQYVQGFGELTDEFWLGLDKIYELTNTQTQYELRIDLRLGAESAYAVYDNFKLASSRQKYKITVGNYRGNSGDAMTYHQGRPFSTVDSDNDVALGNCALTHRGAWWYKNCHLANLNGKWGDNRHSMGVNWEPWKGHLVSLDFTEMKIRPVGASLPVLGRKRRSMGVRRSTVQDK